MRHRLALAATLAVLAIAVPALAHDPLLLTDDHDRPEHGPLLADGTVSFALYGWIDRPGDVRGFQAVFAQGDRLHVELLVPAVAPEVDADTERMLRVEVLDPSGRAFDVPSHPPEPFSEPFTGTDYLRVASFDGVAESGTYGFSVTADAATRFTVAIGLTERFGTPVGRIGARGPLGGVGDWLAGWYDTPAGPDRPSVVPSGDGGDRLSLLGPVLVLVITFLLATAAWRSARPRRDGSR